MPHDAERDTLGAVQMVRTLFVIAALAGAASTAAGDAGSCPAGKPVFRRDESSLLPPTKDRPARTQTFTIEATGRWTRHTTRTLIGAPAVVDDEHGCLDDLRKKALDGALARATLALDPTGKTCHVAPTAHVVYAAPARKKKLEHDEPCGVPFDRSTAYLAACATAVVDHDATDDYVGRMCGGS